jgi:oligoendopeptidase F
LLAFAAETEAVTLTSDIGSQSSLPRRSELPPEQCWDLESIFPTTDAFDRKMDEIAARLPELEQFQGKLGSSSALLADGLSLRDDLSAEIDRLRSYGSLKAYEDSGDTERVALRDRSFAIYARGKAAAAFFEPEILAIDPAVIERWIAEKPALEIYRYYFATLRRKASNIRSAEVEALLADAGATFESFYSTYQALTNNDMRIGPIQDDAGNQVELRPADRLRYTLHQQRDVREAAWKAYADAHLSLRHTLAANYAGSVAANVFMARAHGYASAAEAVLAIPALPRSILDTTIETVRRHFPVWQRYFRVRRRLLGVDRMHGWDVSEMPIPRPGRPRPSPIPYVSGLEIVGHALAPLGEEYVGIMRRAVAERWIDPLPSAGKFNGAFSSGSFLTYPYLMLHWLGDIGSLSVLAHELGHAIHSYYTWTNQPYVYNDYSNFVAEAMSNLNQFLLADHLLATRDDPDMLINVIEERMGYSVRYLLNMPLLAHFERDAHAAVERGEALTADRLIDSMASLYKEAYGDTVEFDYERMGITWASYPHLYNPFYVFQYATGMAAAAALARQVREEGAPAAARLVQLMKAGASGDSIDLLLAAGVDMRTPAPLDDAFALLSRYIDRLEELARA